MSGLLRGRAVSDLPPAAAGVRHGRGEDGAHMRHDPDWLARLHSPSYLIASIPAPGARSVAELCAAAIAGGVGLIQCRAKGLSTREMLPDMAAAIALGRRHGVPVIVNDRVDVALALGADGVHLGQDDLPVEAARRLAGPELLIGATTQTPELAREAEAAGADYVAVGPMYASAVKPGKAPVGPGRLAEVRAAVSVPVCAIGGITAEKATVVAAAGADLLAVISAIEGADDPEEATRRLVEQAQAGRAAL